VFGLALGLNLLTLWFKHFDGLYGQDAYSYFAHSQELQAHFSLFHHWQWEAGPRLLYWPVGYPALAALLFVFTGATPGAAQLVSLLAGAGAAGLLTSLGHKLSGSWLAGLVAGGGLALSGLARQADVSVMADAPALFWTILAVWLTWRARESGQGGWLLAAGTAFGLAGITRYAALTALPLLGLVWLWPFNRPGPARWRVWWLAGAIGLAGLVYLPQFVINQLYPAFFWRDSWLADWSPFNAFQTQFDTRDGQAVYQAGPLVFYLGFGLLNPRLLTPLAFPLVGLGLLWLIKVKRDFFRLVLLLTWWLLPVLVFSGIPYENERFSLTFLPPLALLAGCGAAWLAGWLRVSRPVGWRPVGFGLGLGLAGLGMALLSQRHLDGFIALKEADLATARQVEARLPATAMVLSFDLSLTLDHYTNLTVRDLSFLGPGSLAALSKNGPLYLLADEANLARQWAGKPVGAAFEAARRQAEGPALAQFGRFTLWKLGP
jgi:4-amino-4-deoxy-L-arabinose transferase-like glycosyltransferase